VRTKSRSENLKELDHLEDLDLDGRIKNGMDVKKIWWEVVDWIHLP
jgi:hypothetical protein